MLSANERIDRLLELEKKIKSSNKVKEDVVSSSVAEEVISPAVISSVAEDVPSVIKSPTIKVHNIDDDYEEQDNIATNLPSIKSQTTDSPVTDDIKRNWTLKELESQLDTSKVKDLFTKLPKV